MQTLGYPLYAQECITDQDCFTALGVSTENQAITCCMRLQMVKHNVIGTGGYDRFYSAWFNQNYYDMETNYLNALVDFSKYGYPG